MYHVPGNEKVKETTITEATVKNRDLALPILLEKAG